MRKLGSAVSFRETCSPPAQNGELYPSTLQKTLGNSTLFKRSDSRSNSNWHVDTRGSASAKAAVDGMLSPPLVHSIAIMSQCLFKLNFVALIPCSFWQQLNLMKFQGMWEDFSVIRGKTFQ